jgi:hypothetical protein
MLSSVGEILKIPEDIENKAENSGVHSEWCTDSITELAGRLCKVRELSRAQGTVIYRMKEWPYLIWPVAWFGHNPAEYKNPFKYEKILSPGVRLKIPRKEELAKRYHDLTKSGAPDCLHCNDMMRGRGGSIAEVAFMQGEDNIYVEFKGLPFTWDARWFRREDLLDAEKGFYKSIWEE